MDEKYYICLYVYCLSFTIIRLLYFKEDKVKKIKYTIQSIYYMV